MKFEPPRLGSTAKPPSVRRVSEPQLLRCRRPRRVGQPPNDLCRGRLPIRVAPSDHVTTVRTMTPSRPLEGRTTKRHAVSSSARVFASYSGRTIEGEVRDISRGGAAMEIRGESLGLGAQVELMAPDGQSVQATVVNSSSILELESGEFAHLINLRFATTLSGSQLRSLLGFRDSTLRVYRTSLFDVVSDDVLELVTIPDRTTSELTSSANTDLLGNSRIAEACSYAFDIAPGSYEIREQRPLGSLTDAYQALRAIFDLDGQGGEYPQELVDQGFAAPIVAVEQSWPEFKALATLLAENDGLVTLIVLGVATGEVRPAIAFSLPILCVAFRFGKIIESGIRRRGRPKPNDDEMVQRLDMLEQLLDNGVITPQQHVERTTQLLDAYLGKVDE